MLKKSREVEVRLRHEVSYSWQAAPNVNRCPHSHDSVQKRYEVDSQLNVTSFEEPRITSTFNIMTSTKDLHDSKSEVIGRGLISIRGTKVNRKE